MDRTPFHPSMSDHQKITQVLDVQVVMNAWRVKEEDRAFLWGLADMANDAPHFLNMLHRIRRDCNDVDHSF